MTFLTFVFRPLKGHSWGQDHSLYWIRHSSATSKKIFQHIIQFLRQENYLKSKDIVDSSEDSSDSESDDTVEVTNKNDDSLNVLTNHPIDNLTTTSCSSRESDEWNTISCQMTLWNEKKIFKMNVLR
jgi:hypothetical protein